MLRWIQINSTFYLCLGALKGISERRETFNMPLKKQIKHSPLQEHIPMGIGQDIRLRCVSKSPFGPKAQRVIPQSICQIGFVVLNCISQRLEVRRQEWDIRDSCNWQKAVAVSTWTGVCSIYGPLWVRLCGRQRSMSIALWAWHRT